MTFCDLEERIEFLRRNPIFWSRFGIEYDMDDWQKHIRNAHRHKALYDQGILVHSSVIPVGWTGPEQYDYTIVDRLFELLFTVAPDILFLPRIKLNAPAGWCAAHPEDVFVYAGGPRSKEEIQAMIGTAAHGSHPSRPTDLLAMQSLSSRQWVLEASEALSRFIRHVEASPWASKIIGYHIAYGTSGETTQWGSWDKNPLHKGDYGIRATEDFLQYAATRGHECKDIPPVTHRFFISDPPVPNNRYHIGRPTLSQLFYHTPEDQACVLYSQFTRDSNMDSLESFCKVAKELVPQKLVGVFYGYITEPENCANVQHTAFDRLLSSPYVDFVAAPKGYNRVGPTDPGVGQAVPNSVNRKKLWVDEIDNRTHLSGRKGPKDYPAKNFAQTRAVYWREFTKNIAHHQGYWWMDLGGGWLDSKEIQDEIALLGNVSKELYKEKEMHQSVAEVLLLIDEEAMHHMRPNWDLHSACILHTASTIKECGVPTDLYRLADLQDLDLRQYKLIVLLNAFSVDPEFLKRQLKKAAPGCHILWNYAPGILNLTHNTFCTENIRALTGFAVEETQDAALENLCYPSLSIQPDNKLTVISRYPSGRIQLAAYEDAAGRTQLLNTQPADLTVETARALLRSAGVHLYAPPYCVVNADNRFIYVLAEKTMTVTVTLKEPKTCRNVFTGEITKCTDAVAVDLEEGTCLVLKYLQ